MLSFSRTWSTGAGAAGMSETQLENPALTDK